MCNFVITLLSQLHMITMVNNVMGINYFIPLTQSAPNFKPLVIHMGPQVVYNTYK